MKNKINKLKRNVILGLGIFFAIIEAGVRFAGLVDFPTYVVSDDIGYLPRPSQSGCFINSHSWVFNDRSMGTENNWNPEQHFNILVIGNSIVMGGNPYSKAEKLGPLIQQGIGDKFVVWPIATGGWTNVNEINYLEKNQDIVNKTNFFVWEYMSGGLSKLSQWRGQYVFPTERPICATWYVLRRYVLSRIFTFLMNELPPTGYVNPNYLRKFEIEISKLSAATGKKEPGIIFLYPTEVEFISAKNGKEWLPERKKITDIAAMHGIKIVDISRCPEWNKSLYREQTHPTVQGNVVLSRIISAAINDLLKN